MSLLLYERSRAAMTREEAPIPKLSRLKRIKKVCFKTF